MTDESEENLLIEIEKINLKKKERGFIYIQIFNYFLFLVEWKISFDFYFLGEENYNKSFLINLEEEKYLMVLKKINLNILKEAFSKPWLLLTFFWDLIQELYFNLNKIFFYFFLVNKDLNKKYFILNLYFFLQKISKNNLSSFSFSKTIELSSFFLGKWFYYRSIHKFLDNKVHTNYLQQTSRIDLGEGLNSNFLDKLLFNLNSNKNFGLNLKLDNYFSKLRFSLIGKITKQRNFVKKKLIKPFWIKLIQNTKNLSKVRKYYFFKLREESLGDFSYLVAKDNQFNWFNRFVRGTTNYLETSYNFLLTSPLGIEFEKKGFENRFVRKMKLRRKKKKERWLLPFEKKVYLNKKESGIEGIYRKNAFYRTGLDFLKWKMVKKSFKRTFLTTFKRKTSLLELENSQKLVFINIFLVLFNGNKQKNLNSFVYYHSWVFESIDKLVLDNQNE